MCVDYVNEQLSMLYPLYSSILDDRSFRTCPIKACHIQLLLCVIIITQTTTQYITQFALILTIQQQKMECLHCKKQEWCVCKRFNLYKNPKTNTCTCCEVRSQAIKEFNANAKTTNGTRQRMKQLSINLLKVYLLVFGVKNRMP